MKCNIDLKNHDNLFTWSIGKNVSFHAKLQLENMYIIKRPNEKASSGELYLPSSPFLQTMLDLTTAQQKFLLLFVLFWNIFHIEKNVRKSPKFCCDIDKYRKKGQNRDILTILHIILHLPRRKLT